MTTKRITWWNLSKMSRIWRFLKSTPLFHVFIAAAVMVCPNVSYCKRETVWNLNRDNHHPHFASRLRPSRCVAASSACLISAPSWMVSWFCGYPTSAVTGDALSSAREDNCKRRRRRPATIHGNQQSNPAVSPTRWNFLYTCPSAAAERYRPIRDDDITHNVR